MKILYCVAGNTVLGVLESDINSRDRLVISSKRAFLPQVIPSQTIQSPKNIQAIKFVTTPIYNVWVSCDFIVDMTEEEHFKQFYQEIMKVVEKEASE